MKHILSLPEQSQHICVHDSKQTLAYDELTQRSRQLADRLTADNVRCLALHADNSINWLLVDIACQMAGVCLLPLPTFFSAEQLRHIFNTTPVDSLVCENAEAFVLLLADRVIGRKDTGIEGLVSVQIEPCVTAEVLPAGTNKITFTSGSTGQPKGVCLSNEQLFRQAQALADVVGIRTPRHLCLLPQSTLLENVAGNYAPLLAGGEIFLPGLEEIGFRGSSSIDPQQLVATISRVQPDSIILTPQLLIVLVAAATSGWQPPASLRFVAVGGSRVSSTLLQQAHELGIPAYEGYGLSECASVVSLNTPAAHNHDSSGKVLPHLYVRVVDSEIIVSGNAMLGYVGEPDSWYLEEIYTGDTGNIDHEGYLGINGRKKNVLISSYGRNTNPEWVESEILSHAVIADCVVFGDARPYCVALISPRNPNTSDAEIQQVIDAANDCLPDYAQVAAWIRLPQPLSAIQSLLTVNGRPKRDAIYSYYENLVESLYSENRKVEML